MAAKAKEPEKKDRTTLLDEAVREVSAFLVEAPHALTIELVKLEDGGGKSGYVYADVSPRAQEIRTKTREVLSEMYQAGDFNYAEIADKLRVESIDIQGVLDEDWRESQGLA